MPLSVVRRETPRKRDHIAAAVEGPANGQIAKFAEWDMVQAQDFVFGVPAQVLEGRNVAITD